MNRLSSIPVLALMSLLISCKVFENTSTESDSTSKAWVVSTFAGSTEGFANGAGSTAQFDSPSGVAVDSRGNAYVADADNHRIRKITPARAVSTLAGGGISGDASGNTDGIGAAARFNYPSGVAVDSSGNAYVADSGNNRIRKITPLGVVSTLAGTGTEARFSYPYGVAVDSSGNVYVADSGNHRIRKITPLGVVSTLAGSGTRGHVDDTGKKARFSYPYGVAVDSRGNVYVADSYNHRIRKITSADSIEDRVVTTLAGTDTSGFADGIGSTAQFNRPSDVAVDSSGNVYVADRENHRIRKITPAGVVSTFAGSTEGFAEGIGSTAQFDYPSDVAVDSRGNVYVADTYNHRIRKIEYKVP